MVLELNGQYLIDSIQISYQTRSKGITSIVVIRETDKAFQILEEDGTKFWFLKNWDVDILEKIN
jgi:hypothetical protein